MCGVRLENGHVPARYDAMHPIVGDVVNNVTGGTVVVTGNRIIHTVIDLVVNRVVTTCFELNIFPTVIWTEKSTLTGINNKSYSYTDGTYIWVATDGGFGFCYLVSDGELQGSATGLNGYESITSGSDLGLCQFGNLAEYDHEYTVTQSTAIVGTYKQSYSSSTEHIAYHGNKIYLVSKSNLASATELGSTGFANPTLSYFDGEYYYMNEAGFSTYSAAYDTSGSLIWSIGTSETFYTHDDQGFVYSGNDGTKKRSRTDGSLSWHTSGAGNGAARYEGGIDNVNDHVIGKNARFLNQSDGSLAFAASGIAGGGNCFVIGDYFWMTGGSLTGRTSIP